MNKVSLRRLARRTHISRDSAGAASHCSCACRGNLDHAGGCSHAGLASHSQGREPEKQAGLYHREEAHEGPAGAAVEQEQWWSAKSPHCL